MDRLRQLIEEHGLFEDEEHVIIPYTRADGEKRRIYVLRRPYMVVRRGQERGVTVALEEALEALIREPEGRLWDLLGLATRQSEIPSEEDEMPETDGEPEAAPREDLQTGDGQPGKDPGADDSPGDDPSDGNHSVEPD